MATVDYNRLKGKLPDQQIQDMVKQRGDTLINAPAGLGSTAPAASSSTPSTPPAPQPGASTTPKGTSTTPKVGTPGVMTKVMFANPQTKEIVGFDSQGNTVVDRSAVPKQASALDAAYNLTLRPIVEGIKGYNQLVGTAVRTVGLTALNVLDPEGNSEAIQSMKDSLISKLEPVVTEKYDTPIHTIINGGLQTLGGVGAAASIWTAGTMPVVNGIAHLAVGNLMFNSAFYGSGEAIKTLKGQQGDFVAGALGFRTDGAFVSALGDTPTNRLLDTTAQLVAPILAGRIIDKLPKPDLSSMVSEETRGAAATTALGKVPKVGTYESEQLMSKALQVSEGKNHVSDVARYFDPKNPGGLIANTGENIGTFLNGNKEEGTIGLSEKVGAQPTQAALDVIKQRIKGTVFGGSKNTQNMNETILFVKNALKTEGVTGDNFSITQANNARMSLLKGIPKSWFEKPEFATDAGIKSAMRFEAANTLKDIMANADKSGYLMSALDVQHTAYAVHPALDNFAAGERGVGMGIQRLILTPILKTMNYFMEPVKIGVARSLQGNDVIGAQDFPKVPDVVKGTIPMLQEAEDNAAKMARVAPERPSQEPPPTVKRKPGESVADYELRKMKSGTKIRLDARKRYSNPTKITSITPPPGE